MKKNLFKKVMAATLSTIMAVTMLAGCQPAATPAPEAPAAEVPAAEEPAAEEPVAEAPATGDNVLNVWSFTDEMPKMIDRYKELHPDFAYDINTTIIATTDGAYQPALDQALIGGGRTLRTSMRLRLLSYSSIHRATRLSTLCLMPTSALT